MSRDEQERLRDIKEAILAIRNHLEQAGETATARIDIHRVLEIVERDLPPLQLAIDQALELSKN